MSEAFIGQIAMFAGNFAPRSWAFCNGQLLPISQNTALFSILGTTYGGNGQTNFALPDLRGRSPIHAGQGPGLSNYSLGQQSGQETVTLTTGNLPAHTHPATATLHAENKPGTVGNPSNNMLARAGSISIYTPFDVAANQTMHPDSVAVTVAPAGSGQPFGVRNPYVAVNFIIALSGIFPSRN